MIGEPVIVERETVTGLNAHNQPILEWTEETVEDVLVAPGPRTDIPDTARPAGTIVAWHLFFPKTFTGDLRGAQIRIRGGEPCRVVGDPQNYPPANTPTRWWMPVEVSRADG